MLIDPGTGGSWGGSVFAHIVVSENQTAAPNALQVDVAAKTGAKPFSAMRWTDDAFYGPVLDGNNMLWVTHSRFDGGINALPAHFSYNTVVYTNPGPDRIGLPIHVDGTPSGGRSAVVTHDVFRFLNDTSSRSPLWLAVPNVVLEEDTFTADAARATGLAASSPLKLSTDSCFVGLTYKPSGTATRVWKLIDLKDSLGFLDGGAWVARLTHITNDLVLHVSQSASCRDLSSRGIQPTVPHLSLGPAATGTPVRAASASSGPSVAPPAAEALEHLVAWVEQFPVFARW
jgi:hypothetical protein